MYVSDRQNAFLYVVITDIIIHSKKYSGEHFSLYFSAQVATSKKENPFRHTPVVKQAQVNRVSVCVSGPKKRIWNERHTKWQNSFLKFFYFFCCAFLSSSSIQS